MQYKHDISVSYLNFFQFSSSEEVVFCSCSEKVQIVNVESGKVVQTISEVLFCCYSSWYYLLFYLVFLEFLWW